MDVTVNFIGLLIEYTGQRTHRFAFSDGARFGALLDEFDRLFGDRFPESMWDKKERSFKEGIIVVGAGRDLDSRDTPLKDGEQIKVVPVLAGG